MRKILFLISIAFAFSLLSCTETVEDKIRKEFKNYVNQNFDDPESLKEIVSITLEDTVSANKIAEELIYVLAQYDSTTTKFKYLCDSLRRVVIETCSRPRFLAEFRGDMRMRDFILKSRDLMDEEIEYVCSAEHKEWKSNREVLDESLSKLESDSTSFFTYKIKTRIENQGELSLKEYYARIYTNDSIVIYNNVVSSYPAHLSNAFKGVDLYGEGVRKKCSLYKQSIDISNEILRYIYLKVGID